MLNNFDFNLSITDENQIQCPKHSHIISRVQPNSQGGLEFYCAECPNFGGVKRDSTMHSDKERQFCTVSFSDLSAPMFSYDQVNAERSVMDFRNLEIEHVIVNNKSQGYSPRNLVYVPDHNILVACSSNGTITLWSIGEVVQLRSQFYLEKPIGFAKYVNRGECGDNYLIVGAGTQLYVYATNQNLENNLSFVSLMNCEFEVYDVEWRPRGDKIAVSGNGSIIQIWDVRTFSLERTINVEAYGTQGPIYTLIYLTHTNSLALENMGGVSVISVEKEGVEIEGLPKHFQIPDRKLLGLAYLPKSRCFLLRGNSQIEVLDEESFTLRERSFTCHTKTFSSRLLDSRMLINEDESQCMTNNPPNRLFIYFQDGTFNIVTLWYMLKESFALEVIKDQHRVVMGDQDSGTLFIMRTNAPANSHIKMNQISYPPSLGQNLVSTKPISWSAHSKSKRGVRQSAKRKTQAKSKDQLKERAAKKNKDHGEVGLARKTRSQTKKEQEETKKEDSRSRSKSTKTRKRSQSGRMEIENTGQDKSNSTRKTRSQTKKEKDKTKKVDSKSRSKSKSSTKKTPEENEEKMKDRSKSRKGKKK